ncbi:unnamed protein product, partial [Phaeothamnion confervicola]
MSLLSDLWFEALETEDYVAPYLAHMENIMTDKEALNDPAAAEDFQKIQIPRAMESLMERYDAPILDHPAVGAFMQHIVEYYLYIVEQRAPNIQALTDLLFRFFTASDMEFYDAYGNETHDDYRFANVAAAPLGLYRRNKRARSAAA